ncbi:UNVERIFIED_CONTAM: hypothetical protein FKN15_076555 [Acipenser sinensis]
MPCTFNQERACAESLSGLTLLQQVSDWFPGESGHLSDRTGIMSRPEPTSPQYYVGIDVGTASVRAALVDQDGSVVLTAKEPIEIWEPHPDHYVQSSNDIWDKCCHTARRVTQGVDPSRIRGIGFDATCSLVVLDKSFQPLPVNSNVMIKLTFLCVEVYKCSKLTVRVTQWSWDVLVLVMTGEKDRNVILWMDHRAFGQAERINRTRHRVLQYNLRESCWEKAGHFLDLPDFLSWKATGSLTRSLCTLICKWTYSSETGWDDSFWMTIGLEDLVSDYSKIGVVGADVTGHNLPCETQPITSRLALICGTSSCHMASNINKPCRPGADPQDPESEYACLKRLHRWPVVEKQISGLWAVFGTDLWRSVKGLFVPGVWGPYYSAMVPGLWLNEGGQSATGKLLDHIIKGHAAFPELQKKAKESGENIYTFLNRHLEAIKKESALGLLTDDLHIWPDFHGNRSPLADPALKGMVVGLTLSQTLDDLARLYLATVQAVAALVCNVNEFVLCLYEGTGLPVVLSREVESVLVGAAILGACASGDFHSIQVQYGSAPCCENVLSAYSVGSRCNFLPKQQMISHGDGFTYCVDTELTHLKGGVRLKG